LRDDLGRIAQIEKIEVNPYVLSVRVLGFKVNDKDDVNLAAFDELFINFQLSSLFNWAWTFDEVRLSGPYLYFERLAAGETRLDQLLADFASSQPLEPANEETIEDDNGVVRLLIHKLRLIEGRVDTNMEAASLPWQLGLDEFTLVTRTALHSEIREHRA